MEIWRLRTSFFRKIEKRKMEDYRVCVMKAEQISSWFVYQKKLKIEKQNKSFFEIDKYVTENH